jgi:hypothetical protein
MSNVKCAMSNDFGFPPRAPQPMIQPPRSATRWIVLAVAVAMSTGSVRPRAQTAAPAGVADLLQRLELVLRQGTPGGFEALLAPRANLRRAREFSASEIMPGATRVVITEHVRQALPGAPAGEGFRLILRSFIEYGDRARVATWRLDVRASSGREWRITDEERLTSFEDLYRLSLDTTSEIAVRALTFSSEDFEITLQSGSVFTANADGGITALVLLGRGVVRFSPAPQTERGQLKIFCGEERLETPITAAMVRLNPDELDERIHSDLWERRAADPSDVQRAEEVFREEAPKSYGVDIGTVSEDSWSLLPAPGDVLAEIRTRRLGTLTYARSSMEAEDIMFFDRQQRRTIASYPSEEKLRARGRFYSDTDLADYQVLDYNLDLSVEPERSWLEGSAQLLIEASSPLNTLTVHLADDLAIQSIGSDRFGPLFSIRIRGQNTIVVSLPEPVAAGATLRLWVTYAGRLEPQTPDRETLPAQEHHGAETRISAEPSYLYSSRVYWYPQSVAQDYSTATLRLSVPASLDCVASGDRIAGSPTIVADRPSEPPSEAGRKVYVFLAAQPVRYLSFLVSRFVRSEMVTIGPPDLDVRADAAGTAYQNLDITAEINPNQVERGREVIRQAAEIAQYYESILGDYPYPSLTLALVENELPGGHSPAYFTELNQVVSGARLEWRNDPTAFPKYPEFFIAHEIAHQWWGHGVGWSNYHEQWLSEGFSQYFAALYAQHQRGPGVFRGLLQQMRRWGMRASGEGPVYLGYRIGHIRSDTRMLRAVVYNKGAMVLHMLRTLVGDEAFFRGLRRFYDESRFKRVGTDAFRVAMEAEAGRPLDRFFEGWIYGSKLPALRVSHRVEKTGKGADVVLHVEQLGDLFDVPLTVALRYADGSTTQVIVPVSDRTVDARVALTGALRAVEVDEDGALAEVVKK